jgi:hypothetical protein
MPFDFAITDAGDGGFLLDYRSADGKYVNDSHHPSLEDAFQAAERCFDISPDEWSRSD